MNKRKGITSAVVRRVLLHDSSIQIKQHEIMNSTWCALPTLTPQAKRSQKNIKRMWLRLRETPGILQGLKQHEEPRTKAQHMEVIFLLYNVTVMI